MINIALVHGAFHGIWCWYAVVGRLRTQGHHDIVDDLPGHGRSFAENGEYNLPSCGKAFAKFWKASTATPFW